MKQNLNIPTITDLVIAGNPKLKVDQFSKSTPSQFDELNLRIDELESAIGQDASGPVGRAYAIRAEKINTKH